MNSTKGKKSQILTHAPGLSWSAFWSNFQSPVQICVKQILTERTAKGRKKSLNSTSVFEI